MARNSKYDWPDDQELQALLDEHGTVETARQVGCPPRSLTNRIRRRGLRGPKERREPDVANGNGKPEAANSNGKRESANSNAKQSAADSNEDEPAGPATPDEEPRSPIWEMIARRPNNEPAREPNSNEEPIREPKLREPVHEQQPSNEPYESRNRTFGNDDSASAQLASLPKDALALLRRVPPPIWRVLAVLGLAAVAGIAAFISVGNDPKTYERESSFAVRPSPDVPPAAVNDVLNTLAQPDSAITETIVNMFGSPRLRSFAARSAGVPASSVGGNGAEYGWSATRRTGSTIIDMRLTGPDDDKLLAMQTAAGPEAARLVEASYPPYRLEVLSAPSPAIQVGPKITRTVGLALLLGALLGITLVLAERRLRSTLAQQEGPSGARGEPWER
jgi:hypothetical protein